MTDEQLRAAIMDIVTDAWDRSRQIDGAVDEIMDAVALAAQHPSQSAGEPVAYLTMARDGLVRCARTSAPTREERAVADSDGDVIIPVYASPPPTTALPQGFLADVMTAAGLVAHGKQSKALSERLGQAVMSIRLLPPLPSTAHHAARVEADRRDAELWRFIAARNFQYFVPTRHWRLTDDAGKTLHEGRAESFEGGARAALAAERNNGIRPAGGEQS